MDLFMTHEGDLALNSQTGDLHTTAGIGEVLQSIALRLKTRRGQYRFRQMLGNQLDVLVGQFLTTDALRQGEHLIYQALTDSPLFASCSIEVQGAPISNSQVLFVISVSHSGQHALYTVPFDFQHGMLAPRNLTVSSIGAAPIS